MQAKTVYCFYVAKENDFETVVEITAVKYFFDLDIVWLCKIGTGNLFLNMQLHLQVEEGWCKCACVFASHCHKSNCSLPKHSMQTIYH